MVERFFLNGIDVGSNQLPVYQAVKDPLPIFSYTADSPLPWSDTASVSTKITTYFAIGEFLLEESLIYHWEMTSGVRPCVRKA